MGGDQIFLGCSKGGPVFFQWVKGGDHNFLRVHAEGGDQNFFAHAKGGGTQKNW